jgi:transcriptional/translational regulatory protein YebC/TACO1
MYIDAAKAKTNARYGKMISMAVKTGGNDPIANRQLAKLIEQAKALGVPKVN